MEYIIRECPYCNGELHIPEELETCICIYCGKSFRTKDKELEVISADVRQRMEADYQESIREIPSLVKEYEVFLSKFTRKDYKQAFVDYVEACRSLFDTVTNYAELDEGRDSIVAETVASELVKCIENNINSAKTGVLTEPKKLLIEKYRFFLMVYTVPMINHLQIGYGDILIDRIIKEWTVRYPKFQLAKGSYEQLQEGFQRKGWCFITTAACENMNKPDDCEELKLFRFFRDTYMQQTQERKEKVQVYYRIAPLIVSAITLSPDNEDAYRRIWVDYLQPCYDDLNEGRYEICERRYTSMVQDLKDEYQVHFLD